MLGVGRQSLEPLGVGTNPTRLGVELLSNRGWNKPIFGEILSVHQATAGERYYGVDSYSYGTNESGSQ